VSSELTKPFPACPDAPHLHAEVHIIGWRHMPEDVQAFVLGSLLDGLFGNGGYYAYHVNAERLDGLADDHPWKVGKLALESYLAQYLPSWDPESEGPTVLIHTRW
jgi:hypothetical protein